ncbi:hypothetical protein [Flavobacterium pallidum]|uniref:Outer membrane protein beta-barrel domain-containing protein n=1 Tax=Flavobacterium pallidum TaxID=2172098 RepID=A0A2S1SE12_9FLAO|nr:hypothetical protein [Flavobacterium pallidum]AWI24625.1 hypothetical protein HYN49_01255 [Flavobacterium pallidum]
MKTKITIALLCCTAFLFGQKKRDLGIYKALNLGVGYNYVGAQDGEKAYHFLDLGVNRSVYGGMHGGGFQYGTGTEVGLNTHKLVVGPKVSGIVYFQFLAFGAEVISYTDFDKYSLRFVPVFGIGGDKFRLTFNPQLTLMHKDLLPIPGFVNLAVNLTLDRKERK